jgi:RHS repeat-associated protein
VKDQVGSVVRVVEVATGSVVQEREYDAWGAVLADSNPGWQPFGFAGGLLDAGTGLTRFGARDYEPRIGRWIAKDRTRFDGAVANLFAYALLDPINNLDSNGNFAQAGLLLPAAAFLLAATFVVLWPQWVLSRVPGYRDDPEEPDSSEDCSKHARGCIWCCNNLYSKPPSDAVVNCGKTEKDFSAINKCLNTYCR